MREEKTPDLSRDVTQLGQFDHGRNLLSPLENPPLHSLDSLPGFFSQHMLPRSEASLTLMNTFCLSEALPTK